MTWIYQLYGRRFQLDRPLRWLAAQGGDEGAHCRVWFDAPPEQLAALRSIDREIVYVDERLDGEGRSAVTIARLDANAGYHLALRHGLEFFIAPHGQEVWINWPPEVDLSAAAETLLLNAVASMILGLQGIGGMHGSAVAIQGRAVILTGVSGSGKSTAAAGLAGRGHRLLSDDVVVWTETGDMLLVQPAFPAFMLWPEALSLIGWTQEAMTPVFPDFPKGMVALPSVHILFSARPVPLAAVYILASRTSASQPVSLQRLSPSVALAELLAVARTPFYLLGEAASMQDFARLSVLATHIPVYHVDLPASADGLAALFIELERLSTT